MNKEGNIKGAEKSAPFIFYTLTRKVHLNVLNAVIPIRALISTGGLVAIFRQDDHFYYSMKEILLTTLVC
ncbi:hypothetical protein [Lysinibacillus xylanilyticus]|uniref:Uncharacterized protein n=1 Tax=Lysinibacillus xylanilyticus TaxID=582475 RepID=A0A2M9Q4Y5_9BACI|nr:hypothetical protein [Lysinibacillus xylanilyticus]PJO43135.1 hypothetical protein CWD94_15385 [Lysinibacillus xylanilyticus]